MSEQITYSQAFQQGVREEMTRDPSIFVLGTDLYERGGHFAQVKGIGPEFGADRVRDTPISEAAMVAAGVGAALNGTRPIVELNFIDFAFGAMDEIVNQAAKIRYMWGAPVPLVIRATSGVASSAAQHSNSLEAWFMHTPGLALVTPSTPADTKGLIKSALRAEDPVIFLMHKKLSGIKGTVGGPEDLIPIGKASVVRPGAQATVAAFGIMVSHALRAAENLAEDGIEVEVIDLRSLAPLDVDTVADSVKKTGICVVAGEAPRTAGPTAALAAAIQEQVFFYLDKPVLQVASKHAPLPHSPALIDAIIPGAADVERAVRSALDS
ncbi:MAG: alpha-ketoacid dehydrogenase subunit beta [Acidimicrobiia bacterium]